MLAMYGNVRDTRRKLEKAIKPVSVFLVAKDLQSRDLELAAGQIVRDLIYELRKRGHDMREKHSFNSRLPRFTISIHIGEET